MSNVGIDEAAHHMRDGVDLANMGEKLVAETFAFGGAAHEARDIDEGEPRGLDLGGLRELCQHVEAWIGHHHLAHVRLDRAERIIRRLRRRGRRQRVEDRRLADVGEAEDAALEAHDVALTDLRARLTRRAVPAAWGPRIPWPACRDAPCSENSRPDLSRAARRYRRRGRTALRPMAAPPWQNR